MFFLTDCRNGRDIHIKNDSNLDFRSKHEVINVECPMVDQHISETERLLKLKEDKEFYTKVTEIFVKKERQINIISK